MWGVNRRAAKAATSTSGSGLSRGDATGLRCARTRQATWVTGWVGRKRVHTGPDGHARLFVGLPLPFTAALPLAPLPLLPPSTACWSNYGIYPVHRAYCHEMALRILLACIETHAARWAGGRRGKGA